ncbi:MAG: hypothetical protein KAS32_25185 [Candidatus Peribacteraceae bacterium]|nr:hypothetical protein [Candidatus Peribacteraceae bacterium]
MTQFELNPLHDQKMHRVGETSKDSIGDSGTHGDLFRFDDSTDTWHLANHTSEGRCKGMLGLLIGSATSGGSGEFLLRGTFKTIGLNKAATYLVGPTNGSISTSEPATEDYVLRVIGYAKNAKELLFDPSDDYYTITTTLQPIETITTTPVTLTIEQETILADTTTQDITIHLPTAVGNQGKIFNIKNIGVNKVIVDGASTELIDGSLTQTINHRWSCMDIQSDNIGWYII